MAMEKLADGRWRIITASFEHELFPAPDSHWQISQWFSEDQVTWSYGRMILETAQLPPEAQGSVYSPAVAEIAPGLFRMFFTGDNRRLSSNPQSAMWSAVSTDKQSWQIEGRLVGAPGIDVYYAAVMDNKLYFLTNLTGGWSPELRVATVSTP
jgi:hypothetical protein